MTITAAADGSALGNPGPAGWAWFVNENCWAAGGWPHATNNQGELQAVLELFRATAHLDEDLLILCDSQYVINSVTKWMPGWKRKGWRKADGKPVLNVEILRQIDEALQGRRYRFEWVKGHANHPLNEAADERARAVSTAYQNRTAIPSGPGWTGAGSAGSASAGLPSAAQDTGARDTTEQGTAARDITERATTARGTIAQGTAEAPRVPSFTEESAQPGLFDWDDEPTTVSLTLNLDADTHARLLARARTERLSPEALIRSLL
ncbi:RNase H family protein, partial [Mycetocola saprophilus]|uniref:RNase H family protein n=1 Tax=Mycetocola saprophilus TaxID=76636 RepID=UPI0004C12DEB